MGYKLVVLIMAVPTNAFWLQHNFIAIQHNFTRQKNNKWKLI